MNREEFLRKKRNLECELCDASTEDSVFGAEELGWTVAEGDIDGEMFFLAYCPDHENEDIGEDATEKLKELARG